MVKFDLKKIKYFRKNDHIRRWRAVLAMFFGLVLMLVGAGYIGAKNGWFGGGAAVPEDTFSRGLVGYWSFDEGKGNVAYDASGNGNNGTLTGGPKWTVGNNGGALQFDGNDDYVEVNSMSLARTQEGWFYFKQSAQSKQLWMYLFNNLYQHSANNYIYINGTADYFPVNIPIGKWSHIVFVYDPADDLTAALYVNGVRYNIVQQGGVHTVNVPSRMGASSVPGSFFQGLIDGVRIYDRALSVAEVKYHYNHGGPVVYWSFDEGGGTFAKDLSGNNNDGIISGFGTTDTGTAETGDSLTLTDNDKSWVKNQWIGGKITVTGGTGVGQVRTIFSNLASSIAVSEAWAIIPDATSAYSIIQGDTFVTGKYGAAVQFDCNNDLVYRNNPVINSNGEYYISFWLKLNSDTTELYRTVQQILVTNSWWGPLFSEVETNNKLNFRIGNNSSQSTLTSNAILAKNTWYHVGLAAKSGEYQKIYINGVLDAEQATTKTINLSDITKLQLGYQSSSYGLNGVIDDFKFYNYVRSVEEIRLESQAGLATHLGPSGKSCAEDLADCIDQGLVGYWPMDEGAGQVVYDKSDNLANGTVGDSTASAPDDAKFVQGKVGGAAYFDGKDDHVQVIKGGLFGVNQTSIEVWVKTTSGGTVWWYGYGSSSSGVVHAFRIENNRVLIEMGDWMNWYINGEQANLLDGNWHHIVITFDRPNVLYYRDGKLIASNTRNNPNAAGYRLSIGKSYNDYTDVSGSFYKGEIDELKIYNRTLAEEEVRYRYNQGGPVGHWKFDEGSGTKVADASGNNNDGTIYGAVWTDGKYGGALNFDGINDYVDGGNGRSVNITGNVTVEAWVNTETLPPGAGSWEGIVGKKDGASNGYFLAVDSYGGATTGFVFGNSASGGNFARAPGESYSGIGVWKHLVGTYDGAAFKIFVNGDLKGTQPYAAGLTASTNPIRIGNVSGYAFFDGLVDDVRVYNYVRTAEQIKLDYQAGMAVYFGPSGKTCSEDPASCMDKGLVGYWDMEEGGGTVLKDETGNGNNGMLTGGPKWADGKDGGALFFDGKNDFVDAGNGSLFNFTTQDFSIEAWINPSVLNKDQFIVSKGWGTSTNGFSLILQNAANRIYFSTSQSGASQSSYSVPITQPNIWYHVIAVRSGTNGKIYINGKLANASYAAHLDPGLTTDSVRFGTRRDGYSWFNGKIDGVRIYERALSVEEVKYHYNQGAPMAHWDMDEGAGLVLNDSSGNHNRGLISGATWAQGKYGSALNFDGLDDYVDGGSSSVLDITGDITLQAWFKTTISSAQTKVILSRCTTGAADQQYHIDVTNNVATGYWANGNAFGAGDFVTGTKLVADGQWHHVAMVGDTVNDNLYLYVDGLLEAQISKSTSPVSEPINIVSIGKKMGSTSTGPFNGSIDDVRIYNYARKAEQIRMDYQQGLATHLK